jgi:hypothetical protein
MKMGLRFRVGPQSPSMFLLFVNWINFGRPCLPCRHDPLLAEAPAYQQDFKKNAADNPSKEILR